MKRIEMSHSLATEDFDLEVGKVLVLAIDLDVENLGFLAQYLDDLERERARRYIDDVHRNRFIAARAGLRIALGVASGAKPSEIRFQFNPYGKPCLAEPAKPIQFNLSHASNRALIALALDRELGIDIERIRSVDLLALAERYFSVAERADLSKLAGHEQLEAFFRGWTRKESYVKAIGLGISYPLDALDRRSDDSIRDWRTYSLPAPAGFVAAITLQGESWQVQLRETTIARLIEMVSEP